MIDIVITTFSLRYNFVEALIKSIRSMNNYNIILSINGEKDGKFNEEYRKKILKLCLDYDNIYPIFYIETRGLSKMWNEGIIHSLNDNVLVLNDDIVISNGSIFVEVEKHINSDQYFGLSTINHTFSYFLVKKRLIDELGYFDERLLGFGEEDGDITFRLRKLKGLEIGRIGASGLENIISNVRHEHIKSGVGKYSLFNREYTFKQKYKCNEDIYNFPNIDCEQLIPDLPQYTNEKFFLDNKSNL